jgi:hypothetical protein
LSIGGAMHALQGGVLNLVVRQEDSTHHKPMGETCKWSCWRLVFQGMRRTTDLPAAALHWTCAVASRVGGCKRTERRPTHTHMEEDMQENALHHQTGSRPNGHRECGSAASSGQGSLAWPQGAQLRRPGATASRPHAAESAQKSLAIARCACSRPHMESMSPIDDVGQRWASDVVHGHSCCAGCPRLQSGERVNGAGPAQK